MATRKRRIRPAEIGNKMKRQQMYNKQKKEKKQLKVDNKKRKLKERAELGDRAPPKQEPKSLDKMREVDITMLQPDDEEVFADREGKGLQKKGGTGRWNSHKRMRDAIAARTIAHWRTDAWRHPG